MPPEDLVQRVFLTKPDERGNMKRARIIELINKFDDDLEMIQQDMNSRLLSKMMTVVLKISCPIMIYLTT